VEVVTPLSVYDRVIREVNLWKSQNTEIDIGNLVGDMDKHPNLDAASCGFGRKSYKSPIGTN